MEERENLPQWMFPFGKRELCFAAGQILLNIFLWNSILYGGLNLGFAIGAVGLIVCSWLFLGRNGGWYPAALLIFGAVIAGGFARSDDGFVKFVMANFLLVAVNLGLCLMSCQNRRSPDGFTSLLDAPRAMFRLGFGEMPAACRGIGEARRNMGDAGKKGSAVVVGLAAAVPLVAILISLLTSADAAFEGLLNKLPKPDFTQIVLSLAFGLGSAWVLYTRGAAMRHGNAPEPVSRIPRGISHLTVNTILAAVCGVYVVYLLSQLAYLSGGLSGILPEEFTMAEYARRGFFEMAWLCAINLSIIAAGVGLVEKNGKTPLLTRLLCLFLGIVTVFLVVTASAKMFMYIGSYGLTRLRVLTEVIMLFLGISTVIVAVWLFVPKMAYMKGILLLAMAMGAVTLWVDVDTCVAAYNVRAYQSGRLDTVDVRYLSNLGSGAVPYLEELTEDPDPEVAAYAKERLEIYYVNHVADFRSWNYTDSIAEKILEKYQPQEDSEAE